MPSKTCTSCKEEKDISSFYRKRSSHEAICKSCKAAVSAKNFQNRYVKAEQVTKVCDCCNKEFQTIDHPNAKYCSSRCKAVVKYQREKAAGKYIGRTQDPVKKKQASLRRYAANREYFYMKNAERRARKEQATPLWDAELTSLVFQEAVKLCKQRKEILGGEWHVDHIVPLKGKEACGLHVWNNFQVITKEENLKKGNRLAIK